MSVSVSIVVPSRDRPARLRECLEAIARLDYPRDCFELIVVDDSGREPVGDLSKLGLALNNARVIRNRQALGPAAARNRGLAAAQGDFVAFTDDDCRPRADWLNVLTTGHQADPQAGVAGAVVNALHDNPYSVASQLLIDYLYECWGNGFSRAAFYTSNNLAFPTQALRSIGGFDETFPLPAAEDRDLCLRWAQSGRRIRYEPDAQVDHFHSLSFGSYWNQHYRYGRGAQQFLSRNRNLRRGPASRQLAFYSGLLSYPFRRRGQKALRTSALFALSQIAGVAGFVSESSASHRRPAN